MCETYGDGVLSWDNLGPSFSMERMMICDLGRDFKMMVATCRVVGVVGQQLSQYKEVTLIAGNLRLLFFHEKLMLCGVRFFFVLFRFFFFVSSI